MPSTSIYDNIPNLDSWYACKNNSINEPYHVVPCVKKRKTCVATVSFSSDPPAVFHYEHVERQEIPIPRRNSSSEHVKELLKHYTSKFSRQLGGSKSNSRY